jgi:hypothetical protein
MDLGGLTYDGKRGAGYLPFSCAAPKSASKNNNIATKAILAASISPPPRTLEPLNIEQDCTRSATFS